jgi:hypothetical protein
VIKRVPEDRHRTGLGETRHAEHGQEHDNGPAEPSYFQDCAHRCSVLVWRGDAAEAAIFKFQILRRQWRRLRNGEDWPGS